MSNVQCPEFNVKYGTLNFGHWTLGLQYFQDALR